MPSCYSFHMPVMKIAESVTVTRLAHDWCWAFIDEWISLSDA